MRMGRAVIIPAIVALAAAGSILAGTAASAAATQAPSAHVVSMSPDYPYNG